MSQFHLAENLTRLRREKGITQEKLADFLGVSKASVSKWETGQSLPDIAQLPRLAVFYDVSIDDLMGYEPKLTMAEIKEYYEKFSEGFAVHGFEVTFAEVKDFIRMYYSCDIALLQMVLLLTNHFMMAKAEEIPAILEEMVGLCKHIQEQSEDVNVCDAASTFQANLELLRGNADIAIEKLEKRKNPMHLTDSLDALLIQAYQMTGRIEEAEEWSQVVMYNDLLKLFQESVQYFMNRMQDRERAEASIVRLEAIAHAFDLKQLHTNAYLQFVYAKAMFYSIWEMPDLALEWLTEFVTVAMDFILNNPRLHGDMYFDKLDGYFEKLEEYIVLPRNPQTVLSSLVENISNPVFAPLFAYPEYQKLLEKVKNMIKN